MNPAFTIISSNLDMSLSTLIYLILILGSIIFFALDFKQGLVIGMILNACLFMWFYSQSWNYVKPLATFLIYVVLMSLSILFIDKSAKGVFG
jgi:hypothetical protein